MGACIALAEQAKVQIVFTLGHLCTHKVNKNHFFGLRKVYLLGISAASEALVGWVRQKVILGVRKPLYASNLWYELFHMAMHFPVFALCFYKSHQCFPVPGVGRKQYL